VRSLFCELLCFQEEIQEARHMRRLEVQLIERIEDYWIVDDQAETAQTAQ
jgi:hypothetical protein